MRALRQTVLPFTLALWALIALTAPLAAAADRGKVEAFLEVTGFDVALDSIRLSAESAPAMLGIDAEDFGSEWTRLTTQVFDTELMHGIAVDILEQTLTEDLLSHAASFYATPFGQSIVEAENRSHLIEDDAAKAEAGDMIVDGLVRIGADRLADLQRMTRAVDSTNSAVRAIQEVQFRFLIAAAAADVIELQMDPADLRGLLQAQEDALRLSIQQSALSGAAYTYQAFSDAEISDYADALEHPAMKEVYALMNAVQYEVMANRFEALADAMTGLKPSTDL